MSCFGSVYVSTSQESSGDIRRYALYNLVAFVNAGPHTSTDVRLLGDYFPNHEEPVLAILYTNMRASLRGSKCFYRST